MGIKGINTIQDKKSELVSEWSPNNERNILEYSYISSYSVLWICPICNGEYSYVIKDREFNDNSCPYCLGKKVLYGFNSFAVKHKDMIDQWDYVNNMMLVDPEMIIDNCDIKVWWFCKNKKIHKFQMSPPKKFIMQNAILNLAHIARVEEERKDILFKLKKSH